MLTHMSEGDGARQAPPRLSRHGIALAMTDASSNSEPPRRSTILRPCSRCHICRAVRWDAAAARAPSGSARLDDGTAGGCGPGAGRSRSSDRHPVRRPVRRQVAGVDGHRPCDVFYDTARIAIVPMGFCFPGHDADKGDLPPRRECRAPGMTSFFGAMPQIDCDPGDRPLRAGPIISPGSAGRCRRAATDRQRARLAQLAGKHPENHPAAASLVAQQRLAQAKPLVRGGNACCALREAVAKLIVDKATRLSVQTRFSRIASLKPGSPFGRRSRDNHAGNASFQIFVTAFAACLFAWRRGGAQNAGLASRSSSATRYTPIRWRPPPMMQDLSPRPCAGPASTSPARANLDQESLRRAFRDFLEKATQAGPDAIVFVYLAGRGLQYDGRQLFRAHRRQIARRYRHSAAGRAPCRFHPRARRNSAARAHCRPRRRARQPFRAGRQSRRRPRAGRGGSRLALRLQCRARHDSAG